MKKKIILLMVVLMSILLVGCEKEEVVEEGRALITDSFTNFITVKMNVLSSSYDKYAEEEASDELVNMMVFNMADYEATPVTICGLDKELIEDNFEGVYNKLDYEIKNESCTVTYKGATEEDKDVPYKVVTKYNSLTNSAQIKIYKDKKLHLTIEYIEADGKFVSQYYYENDKVLYKGLFSDAYLVVGMTNNSEKPESIYNTNNFFDKEWTKSNEIWIEYVDGKIVSLV